MSLSPVFRPGFHTVFRHVAGPVLAALLFQSLPGAASIAHAQPPGQTDEQVVAAGSDESGQQVEIVSTRGYDLASVDGRARMMQRIERSVRRVCRIDDLGTLAERAAYDACHDESRADAAGQLQALVARTGGAGLVQVASAARP